MLVTWLGQAGLLFETDEASVIVDPSLSDSCGKTNPASHRRVPVDESFLSIHPDFLIFTHNHLDHYDPETAEVYLAMKEKITVLCPQSVWTVARQQGNGHNYVEFDRHTTWTDKGLRFTAVKATHSDAYAIGVLIEEIKTGKVYYVTGDTLYNSEIFADLPDNIHAVFLPVNGVGNNMNMTDAAAFAAKTGAKYVVPLHVGLMDDKSPVDFECPGRVLPKFWKVIPIPAD